MSEHTLRPTYTEHEGEIVPTLVPPNKPYYPVYDENRIPHNFSATGDIPEPADNVISMDNIPREAGDAVEIEAAKSRHPANLGQRM